MQRRATPGNASQRMTETGEVCQRECVCVCHGLCVCVPAVVSVKLSVCLSFSFCPVSSLCIHFCARMDETPGDGMHGMNSRISKPVLPESKCYKCAATHPQTLNIESLFTFQFHTRRYRFTFKHEFHFQGVCTCLPSYHRSGRPGPGCTPAACRKHDDVDILVL